MELVAPGHGVRALLHQECRTRAERLAAAERLREHFLRDFILLTHWCCCLQWEWEWRGRFAWPAGQLGVKYLHEYFESQCMV